MTQMQSRALFRNWEAAPIERHEVGGLKFLALLKRVEREQASPRRAKRRLPRLAPLYVTADAVRLCIYSTPPPNFGVLMSKILTATYFYENFVPLCCLNAWQTCCAPPA